MRILVTDKTTTLASLQSQVVNAKLNTDQSAAAIATLQTLNPHVDLAKLAPGTVLFVPDAPDFQQTGTDSTFDDVLGDFQKMVKSALDSATSRANAASDAINAESADVTKTLKSAAFKKVLTSNPDLQAAVDSANADIKDDKAASDAAQATLTAASKSALAALTAFNKSVNAT
ncbi:MAG TPA: hypothetical protein VGM82_09285 [Gemmatimonadaceae bacterium]|jgi:hypothetical protein